MSIFKRIFGFGSPAPDESGQQPTSNGIAYESVTDDVALRQSAVFACIKLITETVSGLPLNAYKVNPDGSMEKLRSDNRLQFMISKSPNRLMTSIEFKETMLYNLVTHGNTYAALTHNSAGEVLSMYPLNSTQMDVWKDGNVVKYSYNKDGRSIIFSEGSILHIKLFGNGIIGLDPLSYAAESIASAKSQKGYEKDFFKKGGRPSGVLKVDKKLSREQKKIIEESFKGLVDSDGSLSHNELLVLDELMDYSPTQIDPEKMQLIDSRRFSVEDICRFFGVPSVMINENSVSTTLGSSIEQIILTFYKLTIRPYLTRIEQAMEKALLTNAQRMRGDIAIKFNFEGLLRASSKERAEFYKTMVSNGLMTINQVQAKENSPSVEGGDNILVPMNMTTLDNILANVNISNSNQDITQNSGASNDT